MLRQQNYNHVGTKPCTAGVGDSLELKTEAREENWRSWSRLPCLSTGRGSGGRKACGPLTKGKTPGTELVTCGPHLKLCCEGSIKRVQRSMKRLIANYLLNINSNARCAWIGGWAGCRNWKDELDGVPTLGVGSIVERKDVWCWEPIKYQLVR